MAKPGSKPPIAAKEVASSAKPTTAPKSPKSTPAPAQAVVKVQHLAKHLSARKTSEVRVSEAAADPDYNQGEMVSADLQATVGENLHAARMSASLTLQQVAAASGMTFQYVSKVERGEKNLTLSTLHRLASVLRTDISALLRKSTP